MKNVKQRFEEKLMNQVDVSESESVSARKRREEKRRVKDRLKLKYKRWGILNKCVFAIPKINEIIEAATLQLELESLNYWLIYIDEFRSSSETYTEYGWAKHWSSGNHFISYSHFNMSFMVKFNTNKIEGFVATRKSFKAKKFRKFMSDIFSGSCVDTVVFMDNSKIHKAKIIDTFWSEKGILAITIPTYSPFLNPCEKIKLRIKSAARKIKGSGKIVVLQTFKEIIDNIQRDSLLAWVEQSRIEAYNFIRNYSKL